MSLLSGLRDFLRAVEIARSPTALQPVDSYMAQASCVNQAVALCEATGGIPNQPKMIDYCATATDGKAHPPITNHLETLVPYVVTLACERPSPKAPAEAETLANEADSFSSFEALELGARVYAFQVRMSAEQNFQYVQQNPWMIPLIGALTVGHSAAVPLAGAGFLIL